MFHLFELLSPQRWSVPMILTISDVFPAPSSFHINQPLGQIFDCIDCTNLGS